jgi:hypothetical protein
MTEVISPGREVRANQESEAEKEKPLYTRPTLHWTMPQFYYLWFKPNYLLAKKRRPGTIKLCDQVIKLWGQRYPNLELCHIDQEHCRAFVEWISLRSGLKGPTIANNTVRKLCTHLQLILDYSGPATRRHRSSARLLVEVPYLERPEKVQNPPDSDFTIEEIGLWLGACRFAKPARNLGGQNPVQFNRNLLRKKRQRPWKCWVLRSRTRFIGQKPWPVGIKQGSRSGLTRK